MPEPKFHPGDRVNFLYGSMELHTGVVRKYHGTDSTKREIYSVDDETTRYLNMPTQRYLYDSELRLAE